MTLVLLLVLAAGQAAGPDDLTRLQGEWLTDTVRQSGPYGSDVYGGWHDRLVVAGGTLTYRRPGKPDLTTRFRVGPAGRLHWRRPDGFGLLAPLRTVLAIAAGLDHTGVAARLAALVAGPQPVAVAYRFAGDAVEATLAWDQHTVAVRLRRWTGRPGVALTTGTLSATDPAGKPVARAVVTSVYRPQAKPLVGDAAGTVTVPADLPIGTLIVSSPDRRLMSIVDPTPAGLHHGTEVPLTRAVRVSATLVGPGREPTDTLWVEVERGFNSGRVWQADLPAKADGFEVRLPAGQYRLVLGWHDRRVIDLAVPADRDALDLGALRVKTNLVWEQWLGREAPPLDDLRGWVGEPTTLTALRGNVVLLYWGPFTDRGPNGFPDETLSALVSLADNHRAAGLRVVGVSRGKRDTERTLPFPVAVVPEGWAWRQDLKMPGFEFGVLIDRAGRFRGVLTRNLPNLPGFGPGVFRTGHADTGELLLAIAKPNDPRPPQPPPLALLEKLLAEK